MQTYIQLEGFVKSNNEAAEAVVKHLTEKYKMEKEEVKKYVDGVTVNPEEIYDSLEMCIRDRSMEGFCPSSCKT